MSKSRHEFDRLVERLTLDAAEHPARYRAKVALLAAAGYAYILLVIAAVLVLVGGLGYLMVGYVRSAALSFAVKLLLPLGAFAFFVARAVWSSLWIKFDEPEGVRVTREQAPRLFDVIEETRRAVQAPPVEAVVISDDFNAAVVQIPRLGALGWHRNFLICGLPLMDALSPDGFQAVLAHEMGHLSSAHGRFGAWIYRVRATWATLLGALEAQRHAGAFLFRKFAEVFGYYFNAYSFVLARRQEYEADRLAADLVGAPAAADALVSVEVHGAMLSETFWPALSRRVATDPRPPESLFAEMRLAFRGATDAQRTGRWVARAMRAKTHSGDSHPALKDRLAALGQEPRLTPPASETATERLLGDAATALADRLDRDWHARTRRHWAELHEEAGKMRERVAALDELAARGPLAESDALERAQAVESLSGADAAAPLYRELLAAHPENAAARFALGALLLERDDEEGVAHLERAAELDLTARLTAFGLIYDFLSAQGRDAEAAEYYEKGARHADELDLAAEERDTVDEKSVFLEHGLDAEALLRVRASVRDLEDLARKYYAPIEEVYLVRKQVAHLAERPLYVMGVVVKPMKGSEPDETGLANQQLAAKVADAVEVPGDLRVIVLIGAKAALVRAWQRVPGGKL